MLKYVFYVTSHTIVYLLCLHIHIVICELDQFKKTHANTEIKKIFMKNISWEREPDYGPASTEVINTFFKNNSSVSLKSDPEYGADNRKDVRIRSKEGRPLSRTEIEFINDNSEESQVPYNSKPHFRIQPELDYVNQMGHWSEKSEVKKPNNNILRIIPQQENIPNVGHSRESYLNSQASLTLKSRLNKTRNFHGLSIDAGGKRDIVTYRPRKGLNRVRVQQMQNYEDNKQIQSNGYDESNNDKHKNINYMQNLDIENENHKLLLRAKEKFGKQKKNSKNLAKKYSGSNSHEWYGYKKNKQTTKQRDVPKKNWKDWDDISNKKELVNQGKHYYSDDNEWQGYQKNKQTSKQRDVPKRNWKNWDDVPNKKKLVNQGKHHNIVPKIQRLKPDRGRNRYDQSISKQSEEDYGSSDRTREDHGQNRGNRGGHGREGRGQGIEERGHGKKDRGLSREEPRHDYHKEVLYNKNKVRDEYKSHGKSKELERERQIERSKKGPHDLRVTEGYNAKDEEPIYTTKASRNKQTVSYESIQIDSTEYNSDLQEDNKTDVRMHPTVHPKLHNEELEAEGSPLRSKSRLLETKVLKPYSIGRQLDCLRRKMSDYAIIDQEVIGRTVEYNEIVLWKIKEKNEDSARYHFRASNKKKYAEEAPEKKIIFIVHGLSVMGWHNLDCLSKIKRFETLLGYYMENLDCYDIFLIPMANPDGVAKALVTQPWNKNVSPQNACPGVNLDRNFDVGWNGTYTAGLISSCRQTYSGPMPFSEHESRAVRDIFHKYGHKIVAYFHVHAGTYDGSVFKGDAVLYPKGYNEQQSDDDKYVDLKGDIEEAMRNTSFKVLSVNIDTLFNWYGRARGTSVDYASSVYGIPYAMELVMQVYDDDMMVSEEDEREKYTALKEIWQIIIDVIFDGIYKHAIKPDQL